MKMQRFMTFACLALALGLCICDTHAEEKAQDSDTKSAKTGLAAHYYRDVNFWGGKWLTGQVPKVDAKNYTFTKYAYTRVEPLVNHFFIRSGWFSVRWKGTLDTAANSKSDKPAKYRFHVWADDGCRLYLDGKLLIDSWKPMWEGDPKSHRYAEITLSPGKHKIVIEYFQGESLKKEDKDPIKLYWKSDARGGKDHIIPAANFSHTVEDLVPGK